MGCFSFKHYMQHPVMFNWRYWFSIHPNSEFLKSCISKMRFLKLFLGLIISFGALVCKFGNKNVFLMLWHFLWNFFDFQFSAFTENENFQFFLKLFPQRFLVLSNTLSNSFRLCKFKKLGYKFVSQNVT